MELGLAPDDDSLFEEVKDKLQEPPCQQSYSIKNCYQLVIKDTHRHTHTGLTVIFFVNLMNVKFLF